MNESDAQLASSPLDRLERFVRELVASGKAPIPPYPAIAIRVKQAASGRDFGLAQIAQLVSADAVLAADVLRCANSALYRRGAPVTKLSQAVTRLGAQEVARLAIISSLGAHAQAPGPLSPLRRMIWVEALASAALCYELAIWRRLPSEEAFVLGLLHDFGKVIAAACLEGILEEKPLEGSWPLESWSELVQRLHVPLGVELAGKWGLPPLITEIVAAHHGAPSNCSAPGLLEVVRASDDVVELLSRGAPVDGAVLEGVPRLRSGEECEAIAEVIEKLPEFIASFEAPVVREASSPLVSASWSTPRHGAQMVKFSVSLSFARRSHEYTATAMSSDTLVVLGDEPVPENQLLEAELHCQPRSFRLWALARLSRPDGGVYRIELQPYALNSEARGLWTQLLMASEIRN